MPVTGIHYGCLGLPGCNHPAGESCDCKCHAKDVIYEEFVKRFLCDIPEHLVMSDHQFKHEIQGQLPKYIIQFGIDMYKAGLDKAIELLPEEIQPEDVPPAYQDVKTASNVQLAEGIGRVHDAMGFNQARSQILSKIKEERKLWN